MTLQVDVDPKPKGKKKKKFSRYQDFLILIAGHTSHRPLSPSGQKYNN